MEFSFSFFYCSTKETCFITIHSVVSVTHAFVTVEYYLKLEDMPANEVN
jgi:hypothetical protein